MAMALVFTQFTLLADVSCRAVLGSPVIPYLNLFTFTFEGLFIRELKQRRLRRLRERLFKMSL